MKALILLLVTLLLLGALEGPVASDVPPSPGASGTATAALERLMAGNARYVAGTPAHPNEGFLRRSRLVEGQKPFAVVLGCADSRVPPELIFDHGLGDLFVVRVAGNIVNADEAGSIEYAVGHLDTRLIVVLGHEGCGAVTAALEDPKGEVDELAQLMREIQPGLENVDRTKPRAEQIHAGVEANVLRAMGEIEKIAIREVDPGSGEKALVVGAVYELDSGRVRIVGTKEVGDVEKP